MSQLSAMFAAVAAYFSVALAFVKKVVANEPVIVRFVAALTALAVAFGVPFPEGASEATAEIIGTVASILTAFSARQKVTPVE